MATQSGKLPLSAFGTVKVKDDISQNLKTFVNRPVVDFEPDNSLDSSGATVYRFRSDWDNDVIATNLEMFLQSDAAANAVGLIIGNWCADEPDRKPDFVYNMLSEHNNKLPALRALYLGDITYEENEMSWIFQSDLSELLTAFPALELLRARGGNELTIRSPQHQNLRGLALETGGMSVDVVRQISTSDFPALEHLELWLGVSDYGADSTVQDLQPILSGNVFPNLKYLGLRNCEYVDDIAAVVVNSPLADRLETLDLSLGVLSDDGGKALSSITTTGSLKHISLHHHWMTDAVVQMLGKHSISIDTSNPSDMEDGDEWRYVAVGE